MKYGLFRKISRLFEQMFSNYFDSNIYGIKLNLNEMRFIT